MAIVLKDCSHLYDSLSTFCVYDSFELLSFGLMNHVDTSQLERLLRVELSLMLTTGHVVFCEMFVSVEKLEAVPILCVEQLVLPLFCMNAS